MIPGIAREFPQSMGCGSQPQLICVGVGAGIQSLAVCPGWAAPG